MRLLILLALAACTRAPAGPTAPPETVVLFDTFAGRERVALRPTAQAQDFWDGCKLAAVKDFAVVQCPDRDFFLRFHCADLRGPDHALELVWRSEGYKLYCR